jgi:DNA repair protein RadA/Sms
MRAKIKASFECSKCGAAYAKWAGQCTDCGEWNSVVEISKTARGGESLKRLSDVLDIDELQRIPTEISYLDRILGGGLPRGTAVLLAGEPGIGKSTLLFHMLLRQKSTAVYVSAEESVEQVAQRFKVLEKPKSAELFLVSENRVEKILELMEQHKPQVMVLDSIQMTLSETMERSRGGAAAIRDISEALVSKAKQLGITFWLVGHVTKDGEIAGPKMLEHLVDTVVTFSMAEDHRLRILQAQKNRYGRSGEVVLLEMSDKGLQESEAWNSFWVEREGQSISGCALRVILSSRSSSFNDGNLRISLFASFLNLSEGITLKLI